MINDLEYYGKGTWKIREHNRSLMRSNKEKLDKAQIDVKNLSDRCQKLRISNSKLEDRVNYLEKKLSESRTIATKWRNRCDRHNYFKKRNAELREIIKDLKLRI